ncbi:hypothetical protein BCR37DRAFT_58987 [Protomyces lactucae-debilis]|uniref:Amidohydrolase-related domain-containing protein n=1 Tax=Protomyces lactucae-debilis TaxID=2754530 RepID=A0A1Y2FBC5_PROLT|nr:uncharacterized protein BCR37DRAFT_58987 [Protomyces lactucae-debilis]ORY80927.1 hypothetical protein BCR37DRAFT_58987 [Protomyces lactucae-debilis]
MVEKLTLLNARCHGRRELVDIVCEDGKIKSIEAAASLNQKEQLPQKRKRDFQEAQSTINQIHPGETSVDCEHGLVLPSLCHAHVHLDKCFILNETDLQQGTFEEALSSTAKLKDSMLDDMYERGQLLIERSIAAGVTSMRCMVEPGTDTLGQQYCFEVGMDLMDFYEKQCEIQLVLFAQDPFITDPQKIEQMEVFFGEARLRIRGSTAQGASAIGSAPYVEKTYEDGLANMRFVTQHANKKKCGLDFHLDYALDEKCMIFDALDYLARHYTGGEGVSFGHCTGLTQFSQADLERVLEKVKACPFRVSFVGLPASDLFMMGRDTPLNPPRGTLMLPELSKLGFKCACSINNCYNGFQPHGSCDPLAMNLSSIYQSSTQDQLAQLYSFVSTDAKASIGAIDADQSLEMSVGRIADLVVYTKQSRVEEVVCMPDPNRITIRNGRVVSVVKTDTWLLSRDLDDH